MCFSASASFAAGTSLSAMGVATVRTTTRRGERLFASIPLIFGIQQFIEGLVWLSLSYTNATFTSITSYAFLFFAYLFWPVFIPFAVRFLETDVRRRKLFVSLQLGGGAISLYYLYTLVTHPLTTEVTGQSIGYYLNTQYNVVVACLYVLITCGSLLMSSHRMIKLFGILATASVMATYYFYKATFTSVWCFFAALLSAIIWWYLWRERRRMPRFKIRAVPPRR